MEARVLEVQKLESLASWRAASPTTSTTARGCPRQCGPGPARSLARGAGPRVWIVQIENGSAPPPADLAARCWRLGQGPFIVSALDLTELVREMTHSCRSPSPKSTTVRYDLSPCLRSWRGRDAALRQVVMNLVVNASTRSATRTA